MIRVDAKLNEGQPLRAKFTVTPGEHNRLMNRDLADQHPIKAITGLTESLESLQNNITEETNRAIGVEGSLSNLETSIKTNLVAAINEVNSSSSSVDIKVGDLNNLTTDSKSNIVSAINEVDSHTDTNATNLVNHVADKNNPHEVTKAQVGLGNVDNTSDADKPVSTATQFALDLKVNTSDLGNAELDIQKNGTSVGKFTANASTDKVINLIVPTQASDVNALPDTTKYGASLVLSINSSTYVVTAQLKDQNGDNLGSAQTIDLPLESVVVNGSYDSENKKIILTLQNGNTIEIPVADLIAGLQSEITSDNKLSADLVDDISTTNKFVTASEKSQITTNANNISSLQSGKADKATTLAGYGITDAYTKTQIDTSLAGKANTSLDNLSSDGQMVIDTVDGKISNCILDIPQNIKLTLESNVLTVKSGSTVVRGGSVYSTYTLTEDKSLTISNSMEDGIYFALCNATGTPVITKQERVGSGNAVPADDTDYYRYYLTTNKTFWNWSSAQNAWVESGVTYPIAMIDVVNGIASFAKDSNGNDMIFNGAGFIGHHAFVYPNVKGLRPDGFNDDGSLNSISVKTNSLSIIEMTGPAPVGYERYIYTINGTSIGQNSYNEVNDISEMLANANYYSYVKNKNNVYHIVSNVPTIVSRMNMVKFTLTGTTVTDFTIRQPVRLATTEMTDKIQAQVDTNTTAISGKQDTLVSGTNIKTINSTTVLGNGNFALADQSLSNLDSNGQMIIDSQNGTISNCILDISQNIKLEFSNGTVTLKAGSTIVRSGSTYQTLTTTQDTSWTTTTLSNTKAVLFVSNSGYAQTLYGRYSLNSIGSGSSLPANGDTYKLFFNVTDKLLYNWDNDNWVATTHAYPLAIIEVDSQGVITGFAKDSNGNDMIFNGAGFIGHHAFVYPNVKGLIPDGLNVDGSLKSTDVIRDSLYIRELTSGNYKLWCMSTGSIWSAGFKGEVNNINDVPLTNGIYYVKNQNVNIQVYNNTLSVYSGMICADYTYDGTTVTDFTIRQPVRTATTEMLDSATTKAKTYKGTYNATIQYYEGDIVKSGSVFYEALQDNINTGTNTDKWSKLSNDQTVRYVEKTDNVEYPIGMASSNASGSGYGGYLYFTKQNKPTINASTGVITVPGGIIGKTETAGDNSTKYATTAFVNAYLASIAGYDATKTQTLKNVSGTLTWVDD